MKRLTAAQERFLTNAVLISAARLVFDKLSSTGTPLCRLGDIANTSSGGTPDRGVSSYYGGEIPWLKSGELNDAVVTEAQEFITQEGLDHSSAKIFPKGTLLIALYGATVGKTGILGIDASTNQAICSVTPKSDILNRNYLFWCLRNKRIDFLEKSFGGAQPNISQTFLQDTDRKSTRLNSS